MIRVPDPVQSTWIFLVLFALALVLSIRPAALTRVFPLSTTQEVKGFAILAVVFGHIGYFASADHRFLFPLSVMSGVGVDLFLFVSGYGLSLSALARPLPLSRFYTRRLRSLYVSLWIVLIALFVLDAAALHRVYSPGYVAQSLAGFFPTADLWRDVDSPLWYFTLTVGYSALFPLVFFKRRLWVSALLLLAAGEAAVWAAPSWIQAAGLYRLHIAAFPLGVLAAQFIDSTAGAPRAIDRVIVWVRNAAAAGVPGRALHAAVLAALSALIAYLAIHSGVGEAAVKTQSISLLTTVAILALLIVKRFEVRLLQLVGVYSYGVYLVHWPLVARYDVFYSHLPAWLATAAYLAACVALGWVLQRVDAARARQPVRRPGAREQVPT
ncbi:MAG TPA: acyltransferase [bacterium]|nr:acyltransferase [bacterium]